MQYIRIFVNSRCRAGLHAFNQSLFWILLCVLATRSVEIRAEKPDKQAKDSQSLDAKSPPAYRADRILIKPKKGVSAAEVLSLHGKIGAATRQIFREIGGLEVVDL